VTVTPATQTVPPGASATYTMSVVMRRRGGLHRRRFNSLGFIVTGAQEHSLQPGDLRQRRRVPDVFAAGRDDAVVVSGRVGQVAAAIR